MTPVQRYPGYITLMAMLIIGAIGLAIALSLLFLGTSANRTGLDWQTSFQARSLANACAEQALQSLHDSAAYAGGDVLSLGAGTCQITVLGSGTSNRTVETAGTVGTVTRRVKIILSSISPQFTITSWQEVPSF